MDVDDESCGEERELRDGLSELSELLRQGRDLLWIARRTPGLDPTVISRGVQHVAKIEADIESVRAEFYTLLHDRFEREGYRWDAAHDRAQREAAEATQYSA